VPRHLIGAVAVAAFAGLLLSPRVAAAAPTETAPAPVVNAGIAKGVAAPTQAAPKARATQATPQTLPSGYPMWVLQLNLCNSGVAPCYAGGQSVPEAYNVILRTAPDVVTLNEVCKSDVTTSLFPTMAEMYPADWTFWAFMPAGNRNTGAPYQCANGDQYGIGILGHVPADQWTGVEGLGNIYPDAYQDGTTEQRAWLCAAALGNYYACTTHLTSRDAAIAFDQCNYFMSGVIPAVWDYEGQYRPTVVGGDFNLKYNAFPYDIQDCVPSGWYRKGDGDVQHVMATNDLPFVSSQEIPMTHTDHPGWLVRTRVA
jgi:hypothetical protein